LNTRALARRYNSVQQDWRAFLPQAKASLFEIHTHELENSYLMLSVWLDEAMTLQRQGDSDRVSQQICALGDLCARLALRINAVLHAMRQQARHFGIVPNLAPLEPGNFRGERAQRAARNSNLLSQVLLSERSQFLNKLSTLEAIVDELCDEFIQTTERVAAGTSGQVSKLWGFLDEHHYDLNTCLREAHVLLKSFLFVLPEDQLSGFDFTVSALARARRPNSVRPSLIRARRMAAIAGE
jgi:hypothetical protein